MLKLQLYDLNAISLCHKAKKAPVKYLSSSQKPCKILSNMGNSKKIIPFSLKELKDDGNVLENKTL